MQILLTSNSAYDSQEVTALRSNLISVGFEVVTIVRMRELNRTALSNSEFLSKNLNDITILNNGCTNPIILTTEGQKPLINIAYDAGYDISPDIFLNGINPSRETKINLQQDIGLQEAIYAVNNAIPALCITQQCDKPDWNFGRIADTTSDVVISMVTNPPPKGVVVHIGAPAHTVSYQLLLGELIHLRSTDQSAKEGAVITSEVPNFSTNDLHFSNYININAISFYGDTVEQERRMNLWLGETINTLNPRFLNLELICACCA